MRVATLIASRNRPDLVHTLVGRLERSSSVPNDIIVVECGTDLDKLTPLSTLRYDDPDFRGKCFGHDLALRFARLRGRYDYFWVMMNDVVFEEERDPLEALVSTMERHPRMGILSPTNAEGGYPGSERRPGGGWRPVTTCDYLSFLMRGAAVDDVGFLNPEFRYCWGAIHELSYKLYRKGWFVAYSDDVSYRHLGGTTYGTPGTRTIGREEYRGRAKRFAYDYFRRVYGDNWEEVFFAATRAHAIEVDTFALHKALWAGGFSGEELAERSGAGPGGGGRGGTASGPAIEPPACEPAAPGAKVRIHLGCGTDRREGWINVDANPEVKPDLVWRAESLPMFPDASADVVEACHLFEHFTFSEAREALREWHRVLRPGGELRLELPNLEACVEMLGRHRDPEGFDLGMIGLYGWPPMIDADGIFQVHKWGWTPHSLGEELRRAGFGTVRRVPVTQSRRVAARTGRDMRIHAVKEKANGGRDAAPAPPRFEPLLVRPFRERDLAPVPDGWRVGPPDFAGIGCGKAGTSWWYQLLLDHPAVTPNRLGVKELSYFYHFGCPGPGPADIETYRRAFAAPEGCLCGEWSPGILHHPFALGDLLAAAPETKLLVIVRNPVDRFRSAINQAEAVRLPFLGLEGERAGAYRALSLLPEAIRQGEYAGPLRRLLDLIDPSRLLVLQYERCAADPGGEIARTYRFLGIDDRFVPEHLQRRINAKPYAVAALEPGERRRLAELYRDDVRELCALFPHIDPGLWPDFEPGPRAGVGGAAPGAPEIRAAPAEPRDDSPPVDVSVLLCTYEREAVLRRCLEALGRQGFPRERFEVVCVNDGSTDGTRDVIHAALETLPGRCIEHGANRGLAAARNAAMEAAAGRLLLFINDDTIAAPDLLERHVEAHESHEGERVLVLGDFRFSDEALARSPVLRVLGESSLIFAYSGMKPGGSYGHMRFWTANVSVPREAYERVGGMDEEYRHYGVEDTEWGYRLEAAGYRVRYHPEAKAIHDHDMSSIDDYCLRQRRVARNFVRFFKTHPGALLGEEFQGLANVPRRWLMGRVKARMPELGNALGAARRLGAVDLRGIEDGGRRQSVLSAMAKILEWLHGYYWDLGLLEGLEDFFLDGFEQLGAREAPASS